GRGRPRSRSRRPSGRWFAPRRRVRRGSRRARSPGRRSRRRRACRAGCGGYRCARRVGSPGGVAAVAATPRVGVLPAYLFVPARCVPVNVYWIVDDWFWNEFGAAEGNESVTRRWSVTPFVSAARLLSVRFEPTTARLASTDEVAPEHV